MYGLLGATFALPREATICPFATPSASARSLHARSAAGTTSPSASTSAFSERTASSALVVASSRSHITALPRWMRRAFWKYPAACCFAPMAGSSTTSMVPPASQSSSTARFAPRATRSPCASSSLPTRCSRSTSSSRPRSPSTASARFESRFAWTPRALESAARRSSPARASLIARSPSPAASQPGCSALASQLWCPAVASPRHESSTAPASSSTLTSPCTAAKSRTRAVMRSAPSSIQRASSSSRWAERTTRPTACALSAAISGCVEAAR
jgi:hypothetical protein